MNARLAFMRVIANDRLRHVVYATIIALVIGAVSLLYPLDILVRGKQSHLFPQDASGDVVYVAVPSDSDDPPSAAQLAEIAGDLADAGARDVVVNLAMKRSGDAARDEATAQRLRELRGTVHLSRKSNDRNNARTPIEISDDIFRKAAASEVAAFLDLDFLGYSWVLESDPSTAVAPLPRMADILAGQEAHKKLYIDYAIRLDTIPIISSAQLANMTRKQRSTLVEGRGVLIGQMGDRSTWVTAPRVINAPSDVIHILGAETIIEGRGHAVPFSISILIVGLVLSISAACRRRSRRRWLVYIATLLTIPAAIVLIAYARTHGDVASAIFVPLAYGAFRINARFRQKHVLRDAATGLPNFRAFKRDTASGFSVDDHVIVIARIARLETYRKLMTEAEARAYVCEIARRLRIVAPDRIIYYEGGKYLAFAMPRCDASELHDHLHGLRALLQQPVVINLRPHDVAVTFGADNASHGDLPHRLSAAIAAADDTDQAHSPLSITSSDNAEADAFELSLHARLGEAMLNEGVSVAVQGQFDLRSHRLIAAEALVRWQDAEYGQISPATFIAHCEKAGRLDELTEFVLERSVRLAKQVRMLIPDFTISVNVSAIQLANDKIVEIVTRLLRREQLPASALTIEVTETARVLDIDKALLTLESLKAIGVDLALDDFGIESANLEALMRFPFDELKIDREFVKNAEFQQKARVIVKSTVQLGKNLGMRVVAEGIENRQLADILQGSGCMIGQGYGLAKPISETEFIRLAEESAKAKRSATGS